MRAKLSWDQYYCILEGQMFKTERKGKDTLRTMRGTMALVYGPSPQPSHMRCRYGRFLNLSYGI